MTHWSGDNSDHRAELLAAMAMASLDPSERAEVEGGSASSEYESFERAAALLSLAFAQGEIETMPQLVRERIKRTGNPDRLMNQSAGANLSRPTYWVPWLVAAAAVAISLMSVLTPPTTKPKPAVPVTISAARAQFEQFVGDNAPADLVRVVWQGLDDPAVSDSLAGEVVWSDARQQGFMVFEGLASNDPSSEQYQLWIFDAERDERYPVDGGVFDIPSDDQVIVPINAKVRVQSATAFAVTVEKPGGVVVSSRERIVTLAPVNRS